MFKVNDKVVVKSGYWGAMHFSKEMFYVVINVEGKEITLADDDGEVLRWHEGNFDLFNPKEAANTIAPLSLIQYHVPLIIQWGRDRGILDNSTPLGQSRKTTEEVFELVEAAAQLDVADARCDEEGSLYANDLRREVMDRLADAIGDIFVTLVMVAGCAKLDINACVAQAYNEIKDRKGYLRPDGVFVKEEQV